MWVLVAHRLLQVERRRVVEELARFPSRRASVNPAFSRAASSAEYGWLGGSNTQIEAAEDCERQDHLAVVGLLVVTAQRSARRTR